MVNWSDETYRKPTNIVEIFGTKGKIIADKHAYKIFLKEADHNNGFRQGWNTRYITDFAKSVRFYVRGNEFTRQLDYFVDCIQKRQTDNISSFAEAHITDALMERISEDAALSLQVHDNQGELQASPTLSQSEKRSSIWRRFLKVLGR
jgi:predicted dehydrogenase